MFIEIKGVNINSKELLCQEIWNSTEMHVCLALLVSSFFPISSSLLRFFLNPLFGFFPVNLI